MATTLGSKQVYAFQRAYDTNREIKQTELRQVEWTSSLTPLTGGREDGEWPHKWMVGASGSKIYLHNMKKQLSYVLVDNLCLNLRTEVKVQNVKADVWLVIYSTFD